MFQRLIDRVWAIHIFRGCVPIWSRDHMATHARLPIARTPGARLCSSAGSATVVSRSSISVGGRWRVTTRRSRRRLIDRSCPRRARCRRQAVWYRRFRGLVQRRAHCHGGAVGTSRVHVAGSSNNTFEPPQLAANASVLLSLRVDSKSAQRQLFAKERVRGSSPVFRSTTYTPNSLFQVMSLASCT